MGKWSEFHSDPRKSYYLFLRQGYGCPAHEAHARLKGVDAMVISLERASPGFIRGRVLALIARLRRAGWACGIPLKGGALGA